MSNSLLEAVEVSRVRTRDIISEKKKKLSEQYFTPAAVAIVMAQMFTVVKRRKLRCLDPCGGVGNLAAALIDFGVNNKESLSIKVVELDVDVYSEAVNNFYGLNNVEIINADFFDLFNGAMICDRVILNPPYSKIDSTSELSAKIYKTLGYRETNLYSAFVAYCLRLLSDSGELVAIIPRSFCNGTQFRKFRDLISRDFSLSEICLYESRKIFWDSKVSQEVLIIKVSRSTNNLVKITHKKNDGQEFVIYSDISRVVFPNDPQKFIHIPLAEGDDELLQKLSRFADTLESAGFRASTGKVVDFRAAKLLRKKNSAYVVPLIYQESIKFGEFPDLSAIKGKRLGYILRSGASSLLLERANYILIRRISFKESKTRIVASPLLESFFNDFVGVENHLNYIWSPDRLLSTRVCLSLTAYLSTKTVDLYIRRFSGHTQINATDLNSLPIPSVFELESFYDFSSKADGKTMAAEAETYFFADQTSMKTSDNKVNQF